MTMTRKELKRVSWLIWHHFGEDDPWVSQKVLRNLELMAERDPETGEIVAYVVFEQTEEGLMGRRSGVLRRMRRKGLGIKLYRRMRALARRRGTAYKTYVTSENVASLNAHLRAGMLVEEIELPDPKRSYNAEVAIIRITT